MALAFVTPIRPDTQPEIVEVAKPVCRDSHSWDLPARASRNLCPHAVTCSGLVRLIAAAV